MSSIYHLSSYRLSIHYQPIYHLSSCLSSVYHPSISLSSIDYLPINHLCIYASSTYLSICLSVSHLVSMAHLYPLSSTSRPCYVSFSLGSLLGCRGMISSRVIHTKNVHPLSVEVILAAATNFYQLSCKAQYHSLQPYKHLYGINSSAPLGVFSFFSFLQFFLRSPLG